MSRRCRGTLLYSTRITQTILKNSEFKKADVIFCYVSKKDEVKTDKIIKTALKQKKEVYLPKISKKEITANLIEKYPNDLCLGPYGIFEPRKKAKLLTQLSKIDLFLIPGLSFDLKGIRLGRGKGMFDRFLRKSHSKRAMGLAFECQIVKRLPKEPH